MSDVVEDGMRVRRPGVLESSAARGSGQLSLAMAAAARKANGSQPSTTAATRSLRVAGLFAGIGGIERGLHAAGHVPLLLCENDPGAMAVLESRFPSVPRRDDVRTLEELPAETDLVAAGFPCQDLSQAGNTRGIAGARSGLVGEVFRLLERQRVPWVVLENVSFMLQLGKGRALSVIIDEFERLGYRWAYRVVDTRAFGLPQRRERVFFVASLGEDPRCVLLADDAGEPAAPTFTADLAFGFYWTEGVRGLGAAVDAVPTLKGGSTIGIPSPPAILMPDGNVVKPDLRDAERLQGFPADWTESAVLASKRGHRWKLVGNAVTVNVAQWIGDRLAAPGKYDDSWDARLAHGVSWPRSAWNVGTGRYASSVSAWPFQYPLPRLHEFLRYEPTLLSAKATAGFLSRTTKGCLRFPDGFIHALERHLARMQDAGAKPGDAEAKAHACGDDGRGATITP
jgi:DNA (cytosine-5)-methyltransferase 1